MPNLFNTFSRAALVAIGLTLAPAAFAQGTFNCGTGFTPVVNGNEVTCQMACATGTPTPTITGSSLSFTCSTGGGPVPPSGCKITASPSSGSTATDVTLTLSCTSGTLPINVQWSGAAPGNCPSGTGAMDALSKTCTVPAVAQTTTWTVSQFSNDGGNGATNKSATFTFQQGGGGGEYAACEKTPTVSTGFYPVSNGTTANIGELNDSTLMVIKFTVPSSAYGNPASANFSTQYSGDKTRDYVLSSSPCDFAGTNAVKYNGSKIMGTTYSNLTFKYSYGNTGSTATLIRGQTYYLTIRGVSGCPGGDCPYGPVTFK